MDGFSWNLILETLLQCVEKLEISLKSDNTLNTWIYLIAADDIKSAPKRSFIMKYEYYEAVLG